MMMGPTYQEGGGDAESELHDDALLLLLLLADWPESWICELIFVSRANLSQQPKPRICLGSVDFLEVPFRQGDMMA